MTRDFSCGTVARHVHPVRDYKRTVRRLLKNHDREAAVSRAVGGLYEEIGLAQVNLLRGVGLRDHHFLVDVGCGSGRTAFALRGVRELRYHGIDVVPELLGYAREKPLARTGSSSLFEG